ncbi:haloacid dehalogenase [Arthrobacter crystallopoietes BAB-32]|uniref:Haloacid dehalogenase n=1 Tax=Arthrobacter crystallopoietes BAB-32 TaxID=1246476 RepID=N1UZS8_9MICC|nr:haloacid dehalogenase [Arthrobacter crystallopoietes BAB-32]
MPALVLFDLDGTLVDPAGAITGGISRALQARGLPVPAEHVLDAMVGPPLGESLRRLARVPEAEVGEVIRLYRADYRAAGMSGSRVYPGIVPALERLAAEGTLLAVVTQKPTPIAVELLQVQGLAGYFESIHGAAMDDLEGASGKDLGKIPILAEALERYAGRFSHAVMVGDRHYDLEAAAHHGIDAVAVGWGFAADGELAAAGAATVAASVEELQEQLKALDEGIRQSGGSR